MTARAVVLLALAAAAMVATGFSWMQTTSTVMVAPVTEGQPATMSVVYHPQQLVLTLVLATVAGIFAVLGVASLAQRSGDGRVGDEHPPHPGAAAFLVEHGEQRDPGRREVGQ